MTEKEFEEIKIGDLVVWNGDPKEIYLVIDKRMITIGGLHGCREEAEIKTRIIKSPYANSVGTFSYLYKEFCGLISSLS